MINMNRKIIPAILLLLSLTTFSLVYADSDRGQDGFKKLFREIDKVIEKFEDDDLPEIESKREHPASLFVGPRGQARVISGEVSAVASSTLNVKVWGLGLVINTANARFSPANASSSAIKIGDKVNIKGQIGTTTNGVINATRVNLLTLRPRPEAEASSKIERLIERLRELQKKFNRN